MVDFVHVNSEPDAPSSILIHPVASIFPRMSASEVRALSEDIRSNGLREPLWIDADGRLLDGKNREAACRLAGIEPTYRTWTGDPVSLVVGQNLRRRHLSESQRAVICARIAELTGNLKEAAGQMNVSPRLAAHGRTVVRRGSRPLVESVRSGRVAVDAASLVARHIPLKDQAGILSGRSSGEIRRMVANASRSAESLSIPHRHAVRAMTKRREAPQDSPSIALILEFHDGSRRSYVARAVESSDRLARFRVLSEISV